MSIAHRRTKIVLSLEQNAINAELLRDLVRSEVDGIRLVLEHAKIDSLIETIRLIRSSAKGLDTIATMIEIPTHSRALIGGISEPRELKFGETIQLKSNPKNMGEIGVVTNDWQHLFAKNSQAFLGFGQVVLKIIEVTSSYVKTTVTVGGMVYPNMDVRVPTSQVERSLDHLDDQVLTKLCKAEVDYLVIPGIVDSQAVSGLRERLGKKSDSPPRIILKVDSQKAVDGWANIINDVDGILISRMEMALDIDPASIPMLTKEIIQKCNDRAKLVLTASEMLGSMRHNATPTRAEVSDIANAVTDGSDAVVLSEEVANGPFALRALSLMSRIIVDIEAQTNPGLNWIKQAPEIESEMDAIAFTAYKTAERVEAKAIVCITVAGNTALRLSSYQAPIPIIAVTFSKSVQQKLALVRGVDVIVLDSAPKIDEVLPQVNDRLVRDNWLRIGDRIVFVSITLSSIGREASNLFTIQTIS